MLDLIQRGGATSRAQIARESGLSKPTVSLALGSLVDAASVEALKRERAEVQAAREHEA